MFELRNGKIYQGTGNDKNDLRQLLTKYMEKFGGRKPTPDELNNLDSKEEMPQNVTLFSTHFGDLDEAIKQASYYVPKNNPEYMKREEFIKKAADIAFMHNATHFDVSMLKELDISDELLKKYFGDVTGLDKEIQPAIVAAGVRRRQQQIALRKQQLEAEKKVEAKAAKEVEKQMKEKNKESDRILMNSEHLTSKLNVPTIEPEPEPKPEPAPEPTPESAPESTPEPENVDNEYIEDSADKDEYFLPDEGSGLEEPEPTTKEPKKSSKKKKEKFVKAKNLEVSDEELDKIAMLMEEGKSLKNYYSLCKHEGYVVLQERLARIGALLREKKGITEVLPSWGTLRKTFGPSCKYDEVFGLPFKNFRHTLNRQKSQEAQLTPVDLEMFKLGKQNLQSFLESNWENIPTRKKKEPEYSEKVEEKVAPASVKTDVVCEVEVKEEKNMDKDMSIKIDENNNDFPNSATEERALLVKDESSTVKAKITTISKGNGVMQIMIEREPIVITLPEGVHINMKVTLPKEVVDVEV